MVARLSRALGSHVTKCLTRLLLHAIIPTKHSNSTENVENIEEMKKSELKNNFKELLAKKSIKEGRVIHISNVAHETGTSYNTITSIANNEIKRYPVDTLNRLLAYLECQPCDFFRFYYVEDSTM